MLKSEGEKNKGSVVNLIKSWSLNAEPETTKEEKIFIIISFFLTFITINFNEF